jgi:TrmH family RNA methyltransferase
MEYIPDDYNIIAIETTEKSENLLGSVLPEKCCFIVGNENVGVSNEMLATAKRHYHIPMVGNTHSLNVSQAFTVAMFEWLRQVQNATVKA